VPRIGELEQDREVEAGGAPAEGENAPAFEASPLDDASVLNISSVK
jgi:hypothetical protein